MCKTLLKFNGLTTWIQLNTPLPWKIISCLNNSFVDPNQSYPISDEYIKLNCFLQYSFAFVTHWRFSIKNCSDIQRCNPPKPELLIRDCCNLFQFIITTDRMRIQKGYIPIDFGYSTVTFLVFDDVSISTQCMDLIYMKCRKWKIEIHISIHLKSCSRILNKV